MTIDEAAEKLRQLMIENKVPERDHLFVTSLLQAHASYRGLSPKQADWVERLATRYTAAAPMVPAGPVTIGRMMGLVTLLTKAKARGLKFPKVTLQLADDLGALRLSIAGERSRFTGQIYITDGGAYGANRFYGRITQEGELIMSAEGQRIQGPLVDRLTDMDVDPVGTATEYGRLTGHCCFCRLPLTDPRSTTVGYGEVCADHWGLPWGSKPAAGAATGVDLLEGW